MAQRNRPLGARITAVLGPTNTGKTHLAVERMLAHRSGVIGLPLRLLAREVYDRVVALKSPGQVALITGEEKIVPAHPSYFVCTVESMPLDHSAAFVAVDEIQLAADPERGHVFTDRLLRARGTQETMFLGAATIRSLIRRLVPEAEFISRPRFSRLSHAGSRKLSRLGPHSAIVTFSAAEVYAIAEQVRRQRGGAAVVLGALSPRTRNAQVALFESGEVDYLVATDAIGMGLNMAIDHVAFASLRKYDGRAMRRLGAAEIAQIAGRAGRHMSDGTFGTTSDAGPLDEAIVACVESHEFENLKSLYWRNADLDFRSLPRLFRSLDAPPPARHLVRPRAADDQAALQALSNEADIAGLARSPAAVRLLWEVCRVPDFRKTMAEAHARLLGQIYRHLMAPEGVLPTDWVAAHLARLDRTDGDIDSLAARIAHVRTWTYVSHCAEWVANARHWQERARAIEDKLSDALHQRLTQRFFDRRTAVLARRLEDKSGPDAVVADDGEVVVAGVTVGRLEGLRFVPDPTAAGPAGGTLRRAANRALGGAANGHARLLVEDGAEAFTLSAEGRLCWRGWPVATLMGRRDPLKPRVAPLPNDLVDAGLRERVRRRLQEWLDGHLARAFAPLLRLRENRLEGAAKGLAYHLSEAFGALARHEVAAQAKALGGPERAALRRLGVRFGEVSVYVPAMLKPERRQAACIAWAAHQGRETSEPPRAGLVSVPRVAGVADGFYEAAGFRPAGGRAVRVDMLERLASEARRLARRGPFAATPELLSLVGAPSEDFAAILAALGYRAIEDAGSIRFAAAPKVSPRTRGEHRRGRRRSDRADSPFASLRIVAAGATREVR